MKTRKEAEKRARELYPTSQDALYDHIQLMNRQAYLQCFYDMQVANETQQATVEVDNDKLREAAERVVKEAKWHDLEHISVALSTAMNELKKALK